MANPFEDKQDTTGGKAGYNAFEELSSEKAYDDETLSDNPGDSGRPFPVPNPAPSYIEQRRAIQTVDFIKPQLEKFENLKKTCEATDDFFEREYIDKINGKKSEIVGIMAEAFAAIPPSSVDPATNRRLILPESTAPTTGVVYQAGIGSVSYAVSPDPGGGPDVEIFGAKGQIFPDILAAYHYPALSDQNFDGLPGGDSGTFIRVSRTVTASGFYATNTLGIGETVYHSGDNNGEDPIAPAYAGAVGVVTSQGSLGNFYFFGGTVTNDIGANIDVVRAGSSSSITALIQDIDDLRKSLRVAIGPPQISNQAGINTLRDSKLREERTVYYDREGARSNNIYPYESDLDALTGQVTAISSYNS